MNWTDLPGTEFLKTVFSTPPTIGEAELHRIELDWNGPQIVIFFDLVKELPDAPPEKWKNFNKCRLILNCSSISNLSISGMGKNNIGKFHIEKLDDQIFKIFFSANSMQLSFDSQLVWVGGPSVYLDS